MNNELIKKNEKQILDLLKEQGSASLSTLATDCCSEMSRLVGSWIKENDNSTQVLILKGKRIKKTNKDHEILAVLERRKTSIIDPTVWQVFPNRGIFVGLYDNLREALEEITKKYGGSWRVSEEMKTVKHQDQVKWKRTISEIIKENTEVGTVLI